MRTMAVAALLLVVVSAQSFAGATYQGSLTSADGGLLGTGPWIRQSMLPAKEQPAWTPATITWTVTQNPDSSWHYDYVLNAYKFDVSHLDIQAPSGFAPGDIRNASGTFGNLTVGTFDPTNGSPNMPGSLYGIRFDETFGNVVRISFDSPKSPSWGSFYAKGGQPRHTEWNTVWNRGFLSQFAYHSGPYDGRILVPGSFSQPGIPLIPEPSALLCLGIGFAGIGAAFMRRKSR